MLNEVRVPNSKFSIQNFNIRFWPGSSVNVFGYGAAGPFAVMIRYNGEWIPHPVIFRLPGSRTPEGLAYAGMPAGAYELWAIAPFPEVVPNAPPSHPTVRVGLGAGGASAELTVVTVP